MIWEAYPWRLGEGFCIIKAFITEMSAYASILTITAFTIERWAAICHPMRFQKLSNLSRAVKEIVVIWILSILCALPYPIHTRTFYEMAHPVTFRPLVDSMVCSIPHQWRETMKVFLQFSSFIFFVLPMTLITLIYIRIGITLYNSEVIGVQQNSLGPEGGAQSKKSFSATKARKSVLKMLVAVVVAFFVCWAPFHTQRLWTIYMKKEHWTTELLELQNHVFFLSGVLYFFSATVNPILYNVMSRKYRQAFRQTLCGGRPRNPDPRSTYVSSYSPSRQKTLGYNKMSKSAVGRFSIEETENTYAESRS
eukprot:XP_011427523.1 PREDICTED: neuropeptides capa receptor [Crassostrea gigas]